MTFVLSLVARQGEIMIVKATVSFAGAVSMGFGEVRDIPEGAVLSDLLRAGYVVAEKAKTELKKAVKADEAKRSKN